MTEIIRKADHEIQEQFTARWSPRAFKETKLTAADVMRVLEAARWAPSASNNQPWRFAYGLRGDAAFGKIAGSLVAFNQSWAEKAGALVAIASASVVDKDGVATANPWAAFDTGAAWGYLALQAYHSGLAAHAMGGFDAAALGQSLMLPEEYVLHAVVALGHRGDVEMLPERLQSREAPSDRMTLDQTAKHGGFI